MTVHGDQRASQGVVARHHPIDGPAGDAGCIEFDLLTNSDREHVTNTGQINVQAWPVPERTDRRLEGIKEAIQA